MKLLICTLLLTTSIFAATTGNVYINGYMPSVTEIGVFPTMNAANLNIQGGETGLAIGTVAEICNSPNGYNISVQSQNSGQLKSVAGNTVNYQLSYDSSSYFTVLGTAMTVKNIPTLVQMAAYSSTLKVNVEPTLALTGNYSDLLTFTIAAN